MKPKAKSQPVERLEKTLARIAKKLHANFYAV
jgi:5,10-methylenetetrahydrofolate reductase